MEKLFQFLILAGRTILASLSADAMFTFIGLFVNDTRTANEVLGSGGCDDTPSANEVLGSGGLTCLRNGFITSPITDDESFGGAGDVL